MPELHAKLSASSAHRWMNYPGSIRLCEGLTDTTSVFAEEGTLAHSYAEQKLIKWRDSKRKKIVCLDKDGIEDKDMDFYTDSYRDYVIEVFNTAKKVDKTAVLLIEQRLDFSAWVPEGFGTGDAVVIADGTCHVIDFKYGKGLPVDAIDNPQGRLYMLGAIDMYDLIYDFDKVAFHIHQPRLDSISVETLNISDLLEWAETNVRPRAELALSGEGECVPGDKQCQWCLAKAICSARTKVMLDLFDTYGDDEPRLLNNEDVAVLLGKVDDISKWVNDVKDHALAKMLEGVEYDGFKLVEGRSNRFIVDESSFVKKATNAGIDKDSLYSVKLKGLTDLTKIIGKADFEVMTKGNIDKPIGKPTIAPITDKRLPLKTVTATEAFKDIEA